MKSYTEIPNVDPNVVDFCIYTVISRHISAPFGNSVEAKVNVLFQTVRNFWEPPKFIYKTMLDFIGGFVCFITSNMNLLLSMYYLYWMISQFIHLFCLHFIFQSHHHFHFILSIRSSECFISYFFNFCKFFIQQNSHLETSLLGSLLESCLFVITVLVKLCIGSLDRIASIGLVAKPLLILIWG